MPPIIAAEAFASFAIVLAYVLKPKMVGGGLVFRVFLVWLLVTQVVFLVSYELAALLLIGLIILLLAPSRAEDRVILYLATLVVAPSNFNAQIPFPGLNYLITLNYGVLASLVLLGPVAIGALMRRRTTVASGTDTVVFLFFALISIMSIRDLPFTSMLRQTFYEIVSLLIPYIAISRTITSKEAFEKAIWALLISALILSAVGLISVVKDWNFYDFILPPRLPGSFADRGGFLRINATLATSLLGFLAALGLVSAFYFRRDRRIELIRLGLFAAMFLATIYFTGSRGAILALVVLIGTYFVFTRMSKFVRILFIFVGIGGAAAGYMYLRSGGAAEIDAYGTFDYRLELLDASMDQIRARPLFGTTEYLESGRFDHLVQGQGIIDIVNAYLQIALEYGLVGLALYLGMFLTVMTSLFNSSLRLSFNRGDDAQKALGKIVALCLALLTAYLALIATVSFVSYIPDYGVSLLGVSAGMAFYARRETGREKPRFASAAG